MISPGLTSWHAQYDRLVRSYERINQLYSSSVQYEDDLQHFFQDCWHLKDWIKNDTAAGMRDRVEQEVLAHRVLRIVGDLANAAKHLERHRSDREGAYVTSTNVTVHLGQNKPIDVEYVITLRDGTTRSAQKVAQEAFQAWDQVLNNLGLQVH